MSEENVNARGKRTGRKRQSGRSDEHQTPLVSDSFLRPAFTLEQVRTFLAVASREHVTHAAQVLRLSQPAVTQQVQLLERALGVQLLERVGRNVRLTGAGVEVAGACLLIMRALENLEGVVQAVRGLDLGSVTIGASHLAANYFLPPIITEFAAEHPRINVVVVISDAVDVCQQVASGGLECGFVDGEPAGPENSLVWAAMGATDVVLVANPSHVSAAASEAPGKDVLSGARHLVWGPGSAIEAIAAEMLGDQYEPGRRLDVGSMEAARKSVLNAPGFVAALPVVAVREDLGSGALVRLCATSVTLPLFAVRRQGQDSPAVEAVWQALISRRATEKA